MKKIKINSYTDESGQDTKGQTFVVCTAIILSDKTEVIENKIIEIENESGKKDKWHDSGDKRRHKYIQLLLDKRILNDIEIFYSIFHNKNDYVALLSSHIAKSILTYTQDRNYIAKIFIDKMDNKTIKNIVKEIKTFHIKYKKIRGLSEKSSAGIRLVDSVCGLIRDLNNKNVANSYKKLSLRIKEV